MYSLTQIHFNVKYTYSKLENYCSNLLNKQSIDNIENIVLFNFWSNKKETIMHEKICVTLYFLRQDIKLFLIRMKRRVWNGGILFLWYRLWIRKNEFHRSLDIDVSAVLGMNNKKRKRYMSNLIARRRIAHGRD